MRNRDKHTSQPVIVNNNITVNCNCNPQPIHYGHSNTLGEQIITMVRVFEPSGNYRDYRLETKKQ